MIKKILLSSFVLSFGLLLGRLSGFVRETIMAMTYGVTAETDIAVLMLTVPDLLVNILMGGALGAVLIPEFTQRPETARKLLYQSLMFFGGIFVCVTALLHCKTIFLVEALVPGFGPVQLQKASVAVGWVIWLIPLTVLAGGVTAYLHSQNKFAVASLGTLIVNCSIIVGLLLGYYGIGGLELLVLFVLLGGGLRLLSQLWIVRPSWHPLSSLYPTQLTKKLLTRYGQAMLSGSVLLLFPVIARGFASFEKVGSVAIFNFSTRLVDFPLSIAVTFLIIIFFPKLCQSAEEDNALHQRWIRHGVQITLVLSTLAAITLAELSDAYVQLVYGHGNMEYDNLAVISGLTSIGLISLPLQGLSNFLTAVFNSRKNTFIPLVLNGIGLLFFFVLCQFGVLGIGLQALMKAMVLSYGVICVMQICCLKIERIDLSFIILDKSFMTSFVCAAALLAYASYQISIAGYSAWLSLLLACVVATLALISMALCNSELRNEVKIWVNNR